jgi:hypothetical protein
MLLRFISMSVSIVGLMALTGCAGAVVGTDPDSGIKYSGFTGHYVEADVAGDTQKLLVVAQGILQRHGFETTVSGQNIDGRNSVNGAVVRIGSNNSGASTTHVEVIATEGQVSWNTDYAGQILQDIVTAK